MTLSRLAILEQAPVKVDAAFNRLIVLPKTAWTPIEREGSDWKTFPLPPDSVLVVISDLDFAAKLGDYAAKELLGEKVSDLETVLLRRLALPGELDKARGIVEQALHHGRAT